MTTHYKFVRANGDSQVDPDYTLTVDGAPTRVAIQDARAYGGGYCINLYSPDEEDFWVEDCGVRSTFAQAMRLALAIYRERVQ